MNNDKDRIKIKKLMHSLALKYNISDSDMEEIIGSPYEFTKEKLKQNKLRELTEKEFNKIKTSFIYKKLGRLYIDYNIIKNKQKHKNGRDTK